jgi:putative ABC transport system permease protein
MALRKPFLRWRRPAAFCYAPRSMGPDLRHALRSLVRDRGLSALAVVLLALTTGATASLLALVDAVLWQPSPFADRARTVVVWQRDASRATPVVEVAYGQAESWRRGTSAFASLGVFSSVNVAVAMIDGTARTRASSSWVSPAFFDAAGVKARLGRVLDDSDEAGSVPGSVVISDAVWRAYFNASPDAVGQRVRLQLSAAASPSSLEIVGVMPAGFEFPGETDLWLPAAPMIRSIARPDPKDPAAVAWYLANYNVFYAVGRLRGGVGAPQARHELASLIRADRDRPTGAASDAVVTPVEDFIVGHTKPVLWLMFAGAVLMLVLACSSVAGLQVFRAARQDRAIAIQLALGASRAGLMRASVYESAVLAGAGACAALAVAWALTRALVAMAPADVPGLAAVNIGRPTVVLVVLALAAITGVLTGLWPALFVSRVDAARTLTSGARTAMHPRERFLQRLVVGWQVTAAVVLLTGAALFMKSVQQLDRTPLGFDADGLVSINLQPSASTLEGWDHFFEALQDRVRALPHVRDAGAVALRPLSGPVGNDSLPVMKWQEGLGPDAPWRQNPRANLEAVTPGYFATIGSRLLAGRDFTPADVAAVPNVVIVGASMAAHFWPGRSPVGELMLVPTQRAPGSIEQPRWQTVVGVVDDVRYRGITDPRLDVYLPSRQSTIRIRDLLVRTSDSLSQIASDVRQIARELDRGVVLGEVVALREVVAHQTAPWRFAMRVLTGFGVLAAALSAVGLLGLVSLVVAMRQRELGIRAALGATPARLRAHVLAETFRPAVAGTVMGVLVVAAIGGAIDTLLVGARARDPLLIAGVAIATLAVGLAGCVRPTRRAAAIDPAEAMRS